MEFWNKSFEIPPKVGAISSCDPIEKPPLKAVTAGYKLNQVLDRAQQGSVPCEPGGRPGSQFQFQKKSHNLAGQKAGSVATNTALSVVTVATNKANLLIFSKLWEFINFDYVDSCFDASLN